VIGGFAISFFSWPVCARTESFGFGRPRRSEAARKTRRPAPSQREGSAERVRAQFSALSRWSRSFCCLMSSGNSSRQIPPLCLAWPSLCRAAAGGCAAPSPLMRLAAWAWDACWRLNTPGTSKCSSPAPHRPPRLVSRLLRRVHGIPVCLLEYVSSFALRGFPPGNPFPEFSGLLAPLFEQHLLPWAVAALSGPLHFYLVHNLVKRACRTISWASFRWDSICPRLWPLSVWCARCGGKPAADCAPAWFGGAALFSSRSYSPFNFERQWITIGGPWKARPACGCSSGAAPGLRLVGVGLLITAFVRLAMNPGGLGYQPRADAPHLDWYLYAYGMGPAQLARGRLAAPAAPAPHERDQRIRRAESRWEWCWRSSCLNIEIADYFTLRARSD